MKNKLYLDLKIIAFFCFITSNVVSFTCNTDEDCNLNGKCTIGKTCICVTPWTGNDCGELDFLPAVSPDGALYRKANTSS